MASYENMPLIKILLSRKEEEGTQEKELLQCRDSYFTGMNTHSL